MASEKVVPDKEVSELEVWAPQDLRSKLEGQEVARLELEISEEL